MTNRGISSVFGGLICSQSAKAVGIETFGKLAKMEGPKTLDGTLVNLPAARRGLSADPLIDTL
ncbi:MAG: hypothetical protein AAFP90_15620, partial [Planctomycetota bacterium]